MIINKSDKYDAPPKYLVLLNRTHLNAPNQVPQVSYKAKKPWKTLYVISLQNNAHISAGANHRL